MLLLRLVSLFLIFEPLESLGSYWDIFGWSEMDINFHGISNIFSLQVVGNKRA